MDMRLRGMVRGSRIRSLRRMVLAALAAVLLAACGGDFEYKTSGDRIQGETRANTGQFSGASTTSHENLMSIQEQYKAKLEAEAGKK
ncbi:MAG: hypothetical protein F4Y02_06425 [Chloroflexi bacterium]|nr:hypothetical protein [Chloroflexota bacterium]MYD93316.1 hypothetical protein [Chloroflexota bacterium]